MKSLLSILFLITALLIAGCGTGPANSTSTGAVTVSILGAEGTDAGEVSVAVRVSVNASFTATFTAPVNSSTVNSSTFYIVPKSSANISAKDSDVSFDTSEATISCASDEMSCTISQRLEYDTLHNLVMTSGIQFRNPDKYGFFGGLIHEFITEEEEVEEEDVDEMAPTVSNGVLTASGATTTQMTISWNAASDDVTESEDLLYLVYYSATAVLNSVSDIEANGTAMGSYAANITSKVVTGLVQNITYKFVVIVKDEAGNKAIYTAKSATTVHDTTSAPDVSGDPIVVVSDADETSVDLTWTAATDNYDDPEELLYSVYYSLANNISSVADAELNGDQFGDEAADLTSVTVTGLDEYTLYYFKIVVKDSDDKQTGYTVVSGSTTDEGDPVVASSAIDITGVNSAGTSVTLSWSKATDVISAQADLTYKVYRSDANPSRGDFDTINKVEAGTWVATETDVETYTISSGILSDNSYLFNVIVLDEYGNKSLYDEVGEFFNTNLAIYYPYNGNTSDISDNPNDATLSPSAPTLTTDRYGNSNKAYNFVKTSSQYMQSTIPTGISGNAPRSISLWVKPSSLEISSVSTFSSIGSHCPAGLSDTGCTFGVGQHNAASPDSVWIWLWWWWDIDTTSDTPLTEEITTNWTHFVLTFGSSGYIRLYQNGAQIYSSNDPDDGGDVSHNTSYADNMSTVHSILSVGSGYQNGNPCDYTDGKLDEIRLYGEELSADDVNRLYEVTKPAQ